MSSYYIFKNSMIKTDIADKRPNETKSSILDYQKLWAIRAAMFFIVLSLLFFTIRIPIQKVNRRISFLGFAAIGLAASLYSGVEVQNQL